MSSDVINLIDSEDECSPLPLKIPKLPSLSLSECSISVVEIKKPIVVELSDSDEDQRKYNGTKFVLEKDNANQAKETIDLDTDDNENNLEEMDVVEMDVVETSSVQHSANSEVHNVEKDYNNDSNVVTCERLNNKTNSPDGVVESITLDDDTVATETKDTKMSKKERKVNGDTEQVTVIEDKKCIKKNKGSNDNVVAIDTSSDEEPQTKLPTKDLTQYAIILKDFISIVEDSISNSKYEEFIRKKSPVIQRYFKNVEAGLDNSFVVNIQTAMEQAKKSAAQAVLAFNKVKDFIKSKTDIGHVEVDQKHVLKIKKLEKTIKLLVKKIKELEEAECNWSDEEDSTYMQKDRYEKRLHKVHEKYCKYLKKNPHSGRLTYDKIGFINSQHNEINLAINKKFKNSHHFPDYYEVENVVNETVSSHHLPLNETMIKQESKECFSKLGEILQKRRKLELYQTHHVYIENTEDPANTSSQLDNTLKKNFLEGKEKIEKICESFVVKQECATGDKEDSENSNQSDETSGD